MVEWYLFLPQVRLSAADIAERARHLKREIRCDCTRPASLLFLLC
ncbi:hypothetical protein MAHJHV45_48330 [Mycobacterium avium subsp. hominissuis]